MNDNESFSGFHSRLKDIVSSLYNLGKLVPETRVVKKILRSLTVHFIPKITAIEESKDLNTLTENELLGSLQTFESDVLNRYSSPLKNKCIAFKAQQKDRSTKSEDDYDDLDQENIAMGLRKLLRSNESENHNVGQLTRNNGGEF